MKPPIRIIAPGRTFRSDSDQTHTPSFHQVEGPRHRRAHTPRTSEGNVEAFCKAFFEIDAEDAFSAPRTSPSPSRRWRSDIGCSWEGGTLKIGEGEVMVGNSSDPEWCIRTFIRAGGLDPEKVQGFAFGMGIDRIAMLKYGIPDLRAFLRSGFALAPPLRLFAAGGAELGRRVEPVSSGRSLSSSSRSLWAACQSAPPPAAADAPPVANVDWSCSQRPQEAARSGTRQKRARGRG